MLPVAPPSLPPGSPLRAPRRGWLRCVGLTGWLIGNYLSANSQAAPPSQAALHEWGLLMQAYHHAPDPHLLEKTLAYVRAATPAEQQRLLANNGGMTGFYQAWFAVHPEARPAFRQALDQVPGSEAWHRLLRTLTDPPTTAPPAGRGPSPEHNDYLWGTFFATGQPCYLDSLVAQCRYLNVPPADANHQAVFFFTGQSAAWSLHSNAGQDSTVARYLRTPPVRQRLSDIFTEYQRTHP